MKYVSAIVVGSIGGFIGLVLLVALLDCKYDSKYRERTQDGCGARVYG